MTPLRVPAAEAAERVHTAEVEEEVTRTSHALAALAPVLPSELPISSLRLEPNEGPWRSGSPGDVVGVSPRLSGGIHASAH